MIERVALGGVGDRQARDALGRLVEKELAACELALGVIRGQWLLQHDQRVALADRLALLAADARDGAGVFGLDRHLHLHRLEDRDRVALLDAVADGTLDFPYRAGDMSLDVSHSILQTPLANAPDRTIEAAEDRSPRDLRAAPSPRVVAIVAACNEAERIAATIAALERACPGASVWVADDGSRDATAQLARAAGARVLRSDRVLGKGEAVTAAARAALEQAGSGREHVFVLCDGDLADSAGELGALAEMVARGQADVAVAAFAARVGGGFGLALGFARWAIRRRCGLRTRAPISGQRSLSACALRDLLPFAHGYGMELGMTIDAVRAGYRVAEVELELTHRATGRTLPGFVHRARQLVDFARAYLARA